MLKQAIPGARTRDLPFDEVLDEVVSGRAEAGLLIHEGQLTYADAGLRKLLDLGVWWQERYDLPLPLGVVAIRRDLERSADVSAVLREVSDAVAIEEAAAALTSLEPIRARSRSEVVASAA